MRDKQVEKKRYPQPGDLVAYNVDKLCALHKTYRSKKENREFWENWVNRKDLNLLLVVDRQAQHAYAGSAALLLQPINHSMTSLPPKIYEHESLFDIVVSAKKNDS